MGGEKDFFITDLPALPGSPPHGRGKVDCLRLPLADTRITPAWAGKRCAQSWQKTKRQDHPRMGGEKGGHNSRAPSRLGSPPHGRGKALLCRSPCGACGITPAWAGKSHASLHCNRVEGDHPRMGGEKTEKDLRIEADKGSPPHGRGKVG